MRIHFIGIGGIGVSALARYYLAKGHEVSGCDLVSSEITDQLKKIGAKIRTGPPQKSCVPAHAEKIIYSPAIPQSNPELKIKKSKLKILSYPEALGELTKTHYTIAVSGTHGKSTTTSMIGLLLVKAGFDPTIIVGTKLKELGDSNYRVSESKYLVIEADEHMASFLNYWPKIIVLTTIEADHLDYYKTLSNILKAFKQYISHLPRNGYLVLNKDDQNSKKILHTKNTPISTIVENRVYFSLLQKEAKKLRKLLKIPGEHNVSNALAALAVARILKIPDSVSFKSLGEYRGSWRRFEIFDLKIKDLKLKIVSDYGHHPTKIRATLEGARQKWPKKKIWLVYQPHQYARTYYLWKDFVKTLSRLPVDKLILTDIFDVAGRENDAIRKKVSSQKLVEEILNTKYKIPAYAKASAGRPDTLYIPDSTPFKKIEDYLKKNLRGGEIVIVMGAGNIYNLALRLTQSHQREKIA